MNTTWQIIKDVFALVSPLFFAGGLYSIHKSRAEVSKLKADTTNVSAQTFDTFLKTLNQSVQNFKAQNEAMDAQRVKYEALLSESQSKIDLLTAQLERERKEKADLHALIESLKRDTAAGVRDRASIREQIQLLQKQTEFISAQLAELEQKMSVEKGTPSKPFPIDDNDTKRA